MKRILSSILVLSILLCFPLFTLSQQEILNNEKVISLSKAGIDSNVIVEKIRTSRGEFDLSTDALIHLKQSGVADIVVSAMLGSTSNANTSQTQASATNPITILVSDGTEVEVQLKNNLSGEDAKIGDIVDLTVVRDVLVNNSVVIQQGAPATARITVAKKAGRWGKTGKLEWAMQDCQAVGGERLPMRFTKTVSGGSKGGTVAVATVLTTVLLGPIGLLWGLKKGKAAIIPAGTKFSVYTDRESTVKGRAGIIP